MTVTSKETRVAISPALPAAAVVVLTAAVTALAVFLPDLAELVRTWLGGVPFPVPLLLAVPDAVRIGVGAAAGLAAGLVVAQAVRTEALALTVSGAGILLEQDGRRRFVAREEVALAVLDDADLVLLDADGAQAARRPLKDVGRDRVLQALQAHGIATAPTDPGAPEFREWIDGQRDWPPEVADVLRSRGRGRADKDPDRVEDAERRLRELGVLVRDRHGRQEVRAARPPGR